MLGQTLDTHNRRRVAGISNRAHTRPLTGSQSIIQDKSHKAAAAAAAATAVEGITNTAPEGDMVLERPQTETARSYYETLIWRGIALLQPHSVLFLAEAYYSWYHTPAAGVASGILQQTLGKHSSRGCASLERSNNRESVSSLADEFDVRSVYWLALCHWHLGEVTAVYALLSPVTVEIEYIIDHCDSDSEAVPGGSRASNAGTGVPAAISESPKLRAKKALACCLWLLAMSCTRLEKWQEAEDHLETLANVLRLIYPPDDPGIAAGADIRSVVNGARSLYAVPTPGDVSDLLGLVCIRTNRIAQSESHSVDALKRNPLLWSSCRRLSELGSLGKLSSALSASLDHIASESAPQRQLHGSLAETTPVAGSRLIPKQAGISSTSTPLAAAAAAARRAGATTRQAASQQHRQPAGAEPATSTRMRTRLASQLSVAGLSNVKGKPVVGSSISNSLASRGAAEQRREPATRPLPHMPAKTPSRARVAALVASEKKRTRSGSAVRSVSAGSSRAPSLPATSAILLDAKSASVIDRRAMLHIHRLIQLSSVVYAHALSYNAAQALLAFSKLPKEQQNSAWGLCLLGRICFETGRYPESARAFENGHRLAPYRTRDMDVYSTLLWHMKQEEALAHLAHSMVSIGRSWSPEAWIAVANCFSLDGDHVSALKSIARSMHLYKSSHGGIVVVPRSDSGAVAGLAYAHTLAGHENVASDDLDKAQQAFRTALRINPRHYNAWYGMGMVYLRLGKLDLAEYHFTRALALNPQNPLLLQSAGVLYESRKDYESALKVYERVEKLVTGGYIQPGKGKASDTSDADSLLGDADSAVVIDGEQIVLGNGSHHALNFIMFKRARVLVVLGRFAEAAGALELLQHRCPREFNVPFLLGQTYTKLRRYREAAACLTRALDIAPEYSQSVREAFDALYQQDIDDREASSADSENKGDEYGQAPAAGRRFDGEPSDQTPSNSGSYLYSGGDILSSSSPGAESPYLDSPSLYAGRGGQAEWRRDWRALDSADDRVDRALDFDTV